MDIKVRSTMRVFILIVLVLAAIYFVQVLLVGLTNIDVSRYKGDGSIKSSGHGIVSSGFEVEFDRFNIGSEKKFNYRLETLPVINKDYIFYIRIYDRFDKKIIDQIKNATIVFNLYDGNNSLVSIESKLSKWRATSLTNNETIDFFYFDKNNISGVKRLGFNQTISIEFIYKPEKIFLQEKEVCVGLVLKVGGVK